MATYRTEDEVRNQAGITLGFTNNYGVNIETMGNGKMIEVIINSFEEGQSPLPKEIVKCVESYVNCIE